MSVTDDRQMTDGWAIAYSEREPEFTFAKNASPYAIGPLSVCTREMCGLLIFFRKQHAHNNIIIYKTTEKYLIDWIKNRYHHIPVKDIHWKFHKVCQNKNVLPRVRPIRVKPPMSDVPIFRRKNSDVRFRFRCLFVRSCETMQTRRATVGDS